MGLPLNNLVVYYGVLPPPCLFLLWSCSRRIWGFEGVCVCCCRHKGFSYDDTTLQVEIKKAIIRLTCKRRNNVIVAADYKVPHSGLKQSSKNWKPNNICVFGAGGIALKLFQES